MPRSRKKVQETPADEPKPIGDAIGEHIDQGRQEPDVFDKAIADRQAAEAPPEQPQDASAEGEPEKGKFTDKYAGPRGRHTINLGDGRHLRLFRDNQFKQNAIKFEADRDDVDPRPTKEDTQFMKEHGFRWRGNEGVWTAQLEHNTEENRYARANSDKAAEDAFVELANTIRARNGLEPVSYSFNQERTM
jgi:hypothetical protein